MWTQNLTLLEDQGLWIQTIVLHCSCAKAVLVIICFIYRGSRAIKCLRVQGACMYWDWVQPWSVLPCRQNCFLALLQKLVFLCLLGLGGRDDCCKDLVNLYHFQGSI